MTTPGEPGFGDVPVAGEQPDYTAPPPYGPQPFGQPSHGQPPYGQPPYAQPPYGQPPYGQGVPPAGYPPPPGYYPYPPQGYWQPQTTNGLAVASMVLGIVWIYWIGSILALVFGYVARSQIKQNNQAGSGFAIAGIVLGWVGVALGLVVIVIAISIANDHNNDFNLLFGVIR